MQIRVEFFGIARQRAGASHVELSWPQHDVRLADVLEQIGVRLPEFGRQCLVDGRLDPSFRVNFDGQRFVSDPLARVGDGQCLLVLSADAGG